MNTEELVQKLGSLSITEVIALTRRLEDEWGVRAEPVPLPGRVLPFPGTQQAPALIEQTEFTVTLAEAGPKKVEVIKAVREITGLGLKEAKDLVDNAPRMIKQDIPKADAHEIRAKLEAAGARVTLS